MKPVVCALAALAAAVGAAEGAAAQSAQPTWVMGAAAKPALSALWSRSTAESRERVACIGGSIRGDTVYVERVRDIDVATADSLTAEARRSIAECGPPEWFGTVHTHVRSTDDPAPAPRFSPGDRTVMSEWAKRWSRAGAFCVLYSARSAHCELYPPRLQPREVPGPN
ncbi:MAG TPA: hypothetical protein VFS33_04680 [Gemmatimonadales bacterium]|nr:hypothetical protein [Gemmatimonadales bacterium]